MRSITSINRFAGKDVLFVIFLMLSMWLSGAVNAAEPKEFDHDRTGFFLTGQHTRLSCESCHIRGIFKGIPRTCEGCHDRVSQIASSIKPISHLQTSAPCDDCHTDNSWTLVRMDHSELTGSCFSCHNGVKATGKPLDHVRSSNECDNCHLTVAWVPARFDHSNITTQCFTCHNGVEATGKPLDHVQSDNTCDDCHSTNAWIPARFDHSNVTGNCFSCHNGTTATGKSASHIPSVNTCDDCHSTTAWVPAQVDHDNLTLGCNSCHNNVYATGMGRDHFVTTEQCDVCHRTNYWIPVLAFSHQSASYPGNHTGSNPSCIDCHTSNSQTISWPSPSYQPECAACHAGDYRPDKHENAPVTDNLDCSGTCHQPTPQHRVSDGSWAL